MLLDRLEDTLGFRDFSIYAVCGSVMDRLAYYMSGIVMTSEGYYRAATLDSSFLTDRSEFLDL